MPLRASLELFVQLLAAELGLGLAQHVEQGLLPGGEGQRFLIDGMHGVGHGRDAVGANG